MLALHRLSLLAALTTAGCIGSGELGPPPPTCDPAVERCPPGSEDSSSDPAPTSVSDSTTDEPSTGTTGHAPDSTSTTTGETSTEAGTTSTTTTGLDALPELHEVEISPQKISTPGEIEVIGWTVHADSACMQVDMGPCEPMTGGPDMWVGHIPIYTGLLNGDHSVTVTAFADDLETPPLTREYVVDLPKPGSEVLWDVSGTLGPGLARSVAVAPDGTVYELGNLEEGDEDRCYLIRRDELGNYDPADVRMLLPGVDCNAIAVAVDADESVHVLVTRTVNASKLWWLGRYDSWVAPETNMAFGAVGEVATALAMHPSKSQVAVCGTRPTFTEDELDVKVAFFSKDSPGLGLPPLDYQPEGEPNRFTENARDCAYTPSGLLVVTGEALGKHPNDDDAPRSHVFLLEIESHMGEHAWHVDIDEPGAFTQSGARGLAITDSGDAITLGYVKPDMGPSMLHLRNYAPGGTPTGWSAFPDASATFPADIAWSPAGYALLATGRLEGQLWTDFWVEAWKPGADAPEWTFARSDAPSLYVALGVAAAKDGRVYVVGIAALGDIGVPAFAVLNP